jgi:tRNA (cmo5U34)-methyltransferase
MDQVKQHFNQEAEKFDRIILQLIPYYQQMLNALILAIPFDKQCDLRVLDLGCGTGTVALNVLQTFPHAQVTCLDFSEQMIEMAKAKLKDFDHVHYLVQDFRDCNFSNPYHVVVSSLALHHLVTDEEKRVFYQKIHDGLLPGGCFYNADVVLASSDHLQRINLDRWQEYMLRQISADEVQRVWLQKYREEDRPSELIQQLSWLTAIGFQNVDVLWKYFNFAVYGGLKSTGI